MSMRYYLRRLAQAVITFITAMFITYSLYRFIPGGPIQQMQNELIRRAAAQGRAVNPERIARLVEADTGINPDQGVIVAFIGYIQHILQGEFGQSIVYNRGVFKILFGAMPWSMFIQSYGLVLGLSTQILLGSLMAWKEGSKLDKGLTVFVMGLNSIPYYVVAIVALVFFGFQWNLLPTGGRYPSSATPGFNLPFMIGIVKHAILPVMSAYIVGVGFGAVQMRGLGVSVIGSDYLRSARIRGLSSNRILTRYVARNTVLPIYTGIVIGIAALFSSSVVTEQIFQYVGVGWYIFDAVRLQDYPLVMGAFIFFVGLTIIGILIADLTYGLIDPRAGSPGEREAY
ncbi:MAG: ABC transporter permease [Haloarculaceae archaeon]